MANQEITEPTLPVSEIFLSIEGEGPYTGHPMVFVRTFGCNFTCSGFNSGEGPQGCDSAYSWHKDYKNQAPKYTVSSLLDALHAIYGKLPNAPILCFTGGEPTLHQRFLTEFLIACKNVEMFSTILFETNASIFLNPGFREALGLWTNCRINRKLVWASSPKLSNSGEPRYKAINPAALVQQVPQNYTRCEQYLKFVSSGSDASFVEIQQAVSEYNAALMQDSMPGHKLFNRKNVYVMPEGTTKDQQERIQRRVAEACIKHGYIFCARIHVWIWNNEKGT
jgi:7-carboxy-7-deazaguanine synthase